MKIEIHDVENAELEPLLKAVERAARYSLNGDHIDIYCAQRGTQNSNLQWLEYGIQIMRNDQLRLHVAMIQRTLTAEFEFHS